MDKNKYSLYDEDLSIPNIEKNACSNYMLDNSYEGFKYYGDKNKCMLFNTNNFNKKLDKYKDYNIKSFIKTKDIIDLDNRFEQNNSYNYFNQINNNYLIPDHLIKEYIVNNEKDCLDYCIRDHNDCKSLIYLEQPKLCTFYKKKKFKNKDENYNNYDIYTKNSKINNNILLPNEILNVKSYKKETGNLMDISNIPLYNCAGLISTNPFCTNELNLDNLNFKNNYINYTDCTTNNDYNKECKKKYGNEYIFDNDIYNLASVIDCNNGEKRAKCKIDFNDIIENFENNQNKNNNKFIIIIFLIFFIYLFYIIFFFKIIYFI